MQPLNLPAFPFKVTEAEGKKMIFDPVRKKHLVLTPEEWVRQHFIQFLIREKGYPAGLLRLEAKVMHYRRSGRYDALFLNRSGIPVLLIECKAPKVKIESETFEQAVRYNSSVGAPYIALTNGMEHFFMRVDHRERRVNFLEEIPEYQYLSTDN